MNQITRYLLAFALIAIASCTKNDNGGNTPATFQDSIKISGVYTGNLYTNTQAVISNPPINTWDTTKSMQIKITLLDSTRVSLHTVTPFTLMLHDTIQRRATSSSTIQNADMYFYEYRQRANMVYYIYYFEAQDSIYIHASPTPSGGYNTLHYYYGKK